MVKDAEAKASEEAETQALTRELALTPKLKAKAFAAEFRQILENKRSRARFLSPQKSKD